MTINRIPLDYYVGGQHLHQDKYAEISPVIGHGVELDGKYYRITDVWTFSGTSVFTSRTTAVMLDEVQLPAALQAGAAAHRR